MSIIEGEKMGIVLALIMATFIGGVAGYLGTLMLTKRMALVAGPLGHLTLPGIALGLLYGFDISLGAFLFVILGVALIWLFEIRTKLPMEALTAIVFASGVAITFLFLPEEQTIPALIGDISQISIPVATFTVFVSFIVFLIIRTIYSKMILLSISEDLAKVNGIDVKKYNLVYLMCVAIVVSIGIRVVGGLMTAALVAIPACTSRNLTKSLFQYSFGGLMFGGLSSFLGILGFRFTLIPAGILIILTSTLFFLASLIFKRR